MEVEVVNGLVGVGGDGENEVMNKITEKGCRILV